MGTGVEEGTKALGPVWAGPERSDGERSEPPRSGQPARRLARTVPVLLGFRCALLIVARSGRVNG